MNFNFYHTSIAVLDLEKSLSFYEKALGFTETRRIVAEDGSFIIVFVGAEGSGAQVELTWYRDRTEPWNLGDNEYHLGFRTDNIDAARALHEEMNCICFVNEKMGLYFIEDPDGYWIEIVPIR